MATPADTLAAQPRPLPAPQTGALTAPEGADALAAVPGMGQQIARNTIAAGQTNNGNPRDWAENAVAGVQAALAGFGAAGKVPEGAGALYGVGAAARAAQEQRAQQQKAKQEQQQQLTQQQLAQAQIAHLNAEQHNIERLGRNADRESMQKLVDSDVQASQPFAASGAPNLGEHLTSDELQQKLKDGEINGHEVHVFKDGMTDVIGPDGKPVVDAEGIPMQRPTYRLFGAAQAIELGADQAKLIADNTPYHPVAGQKMSGEDYYTLTTLAKKNQAVDLNIQKVQSEIGKNTAEEKKAEGETQSAADQKDLVQQAAKLLSPYLARANGDPWRATQLMAQDPTGRAGLGVVEQAYGPGNIEKWHTDQEEAQAKQEELQQKKLAEQTTTWGDPAATSPEAFRASLTPEQQAAVDLVGRGRAPLNSPSYLLARNPGFVAAVAALYPDVDLSKIDAYKEAYKKFTTGKQGDAVNAGATALEHLNELKDLNTPESMIPGTPAHTQYQNKVGTVVGELMNFYQMAKTEASKSDMEKTLNSMTSWNRNAAILTQAKSMGDKLDSYKDQWDAAAPSPQYEAQYPGISDTLKAQKARASLDPNYAALHPELANVPAPVQNVLKTAPVGRHKLSDGSVWDKRPDGSIVQAQ